MRFAALTLGLATFTLSGCGLAECAKGFRLAAEGGCEIDWPAPCPEGEVRTIAGECVAPYTTTNGTGGGVDTDDTRNPPDTDTDIIIDPPDTDDPRDTDIIDTSRPGDTWTPGQDTEQPGGDTGDTSSAPSTPAPPDSGF
jgi:hypothetical protein